MVVGLLAHAVVDAVVADERLQRGEDRARCVDVLGRPSDEAHVLTLDAPLPFVLTPPDIGDRLAGTQQLVVLDRAIELAD